MSIVESTTGEVVCRSLDELETVIAAGIASFIAVGNALADVRDHRLYRDTHETFDAYCIDRWGWDRKRASEFILAAEVSEISDSPIVNEAHASALSPLRDDPEALNSAIETAIAQAEADGAKLTAKRIKDAVAQIAGDGGNLDSGSVEGGTTPVAVEPDPSPATDAGEEPHHSGHGTSPATPSEAESVGPDGVASEADPAGCPSLPAGSEDSPAIIVARKRKLAAAELKKATGFFQLVDAEEFHDYATPELAEQLRLTIEVVNRWCDRYKASKPSGLRVVNGGKQ